MSIKNKICGIYKITSPSDKIYIGQSVNCIKRKWDYASADCKCQTKLFNSIKKHGWDAHKFEIIHQCDEKELNSLEIYYINLFQTFNSEHGMNLRHGGGKSGGLSEETKKKIGIANTGKVRTEETRKKISEHNIRLGKTPPSRKGIRHTNEYKVRLSEKMKGCPDRRSPESILRFKKMRKGHEVTEETRRKISKNVKKYYANKHKQPNEGNS